MKYPVKVFKFGGASVRHAAAIRQVKSIIAAHKDDHILVVVSAMGKTTNALERVVTGFAQGSAFREEIELLKSHHYQEMKALFREDHPIWNRVSQEFQSLEKKLTTQTDADKLYDQIVSVGEVLSSLIVSAFLSHESIPTAWIDARDYIVTDSTYREGKVDWDATEKKIKALKEVLSGKIIVTQGFIGRDQHGFTTTLGREGSDYSAAIFASCLPAESVTIWKDVPGVMNADPKRIKDAKVFEELPFGEAAEMTYYGATVIHPKTIKPLANRNIPLYVKNFDDPALPGTTIHETKLDYLQPLIVFKDNQCLVSCRVTDYTFIDERQLSSIFAALSEFNIRINVMQNSAISFSFCIDFREDKVLKLIERLAGQFEVYYNTGLTLITVKNYDARTFQEYRGKPGVLLEQTSRSTLQVLLRQ